MSRESVHIYSQRLNGGEKSALQIAEQASQVRLIMASQPALTRSLIFLNVPSRKYLSRLEIAQESLLLILAAA